MEVGQIKSGSDAKDSFHKMLQHVRGVTPHVADSITARFKSVAALIQGFQRGGADILQNLTVFVIERLALIVFRYGILKPGALESEVLDNTCQGRFTMRS
jgi:hypothetical protein